MKFPYRRKYSFMKFYEIVAVHLLVKHTHTHTEAGDNWTYAFFAIFFLIGYLGCTIAWLMSGNMMILPLAWKVSLIHPYILAFGESLTCASRDLQFTTVDCTKSNFHIAIVHLYTYMFSEEYLTIYSLSTPLTLLSMLVMRNTM